MAELKGYDKRREVSFKKALSICEANGLIPHFSFSNWKGFVGKGPDGKSMNLRYEVECSTCHKVYQTWFKSSKPLNRSCIRCCSDAQNVVKNPHKDLSSNPFYKFLSEQFPDLQLNYQIEEGYNLTYYIPSKQVGFKLVSYKSFTLGQPHSKISDRWYFQKLAEQGLSKGIKVYTIWQSTATSLSLSIMQSKLGISKRIYARNCSVKEVSAKDAKIFFDLNHIDGFARSSIYYALLYKDKYVAMMTLMNRRLQSRKINAWEIGRFATAQFITVVGGYSKLLKHSLSYLKNLGVEQLFSYCDRDISPDSEATFYAKNGFSLITNSGLIYKYWCSRDVNYYGQRKQGDLLGRQALQKQKLLSWFRQNNLEFEDSDSEMKLAARLGMYPAFNAGNWKYVLDIK